MHGTQAENATRQARFARIVEPQLARLLAFARRRTASEADAEDAVQECCAHAWVALDDLRDDASAAAWLYQILRNELGRRRVTAARRERIAAIVRWDEERCVRVAANTPNALDDVIASATARSVEQALRRIPEHYAAAIELRDLEGLSCREVADVLGVPVGTVLSRVHRGRRLLAGLIADQHELSTQGEREVNAAPSQWLRRDASPRLEARSETQTGADARREVGR